MCMCVCRGVFACVYVYVWMLKFWKTRVSVSQEFDRDKI